MNYKFNDFATAIIICRLWDFSTFFENKSGLLILKNCKKQGDFKYLY